MAYSTDKSKELFQRALEVMVEGGSSPSRGPANYGEYPIFIERGEGSRVYDVDGNTYVDWMMAYGALPLGHAHPRIVHALSVGASRGTLLAAATETEVQVAELIQKLVPGAERVRFANTGTEAAMAAIRLARGYTGRPMFVKFEGHYHGWYDDFLVNAHPHAPVSLGHRNDPVRIAESSGLNRRALEDTIVVPWNDLNALERAIETHRGRIAAIISEGIMANMGVIPPVKGYLKSVQQLARDNGILFILDETVTGFRISAGGCQKYYGLDPDISTFGKALGAGLPVAAFCGKAEIMEALAWGGVLHYGTQNASRIGLYAARAFLREISEDDGAFFKHTWSIGEKLAEGLRDAFKVTDTRAIVQAVGPMLQIMFTAREHIRDYREFCAHVDRKKYQKFALALFQHGVYLSPSAALHSVTSLAHTDEDVALTLEAAKKALIDVEG
ncbi:MAG TPA: aspartate aminotransferase family protein [Gemmatimonadota bacterium]|nr:aspartate aminotransferase family protein [Gemmatimonadota bacterium]